MAKPFSIQSPEQIAKEYGGNKQKIGEAMQMGIVDATAGVLAGMFIDRMRAAQMQEQAPQQTVAQQVMNPQPQMPPQGAPAQVPPAPQPGAPAGLGAIAPQGGEPMPMPMPAPEMAPPMPEEAPMGMAMGGIAGLPVPDDMFDEPSNGGFNDGYAGGGIVAFADGGTTDLDQFRRAIIQQESGGRYGIANTQGSGAMGIGQIMPDTARALAKRLGLAYRPDLLAGTNAEARKYQDALTAEATREAWDYGKGDPRTAAAYYFAGPDKKGWGKKTAQYQNDILRRMGAEGEESTTAGSVPREADTSTAKGRNITLEDSLMAGRSLTSGLPHQELERAKAYAMEELDPANQEKERKADMWMALSQMGFRMASTQSPSLLQAIGEAATATLPEVAASKKERKAAKNEAVRTLMAVEDVDRKTALAGVEVGMEIYKSNLSQEELQQRMALANREISSREEIAKLDRDAQLKIATARQANPSDFDTKLAIIMQANPGMNPLQALMYGQEQGFFGNTAQGGGWPGQQGGGAQPNNGGMSIVGSRPAQ